MTLIISLVVLLLVLYFLKFFKEILVAIIFFSLAKQGMVIEAIFASIVIYILILILQRIYNSGKDEP